MKHTLKRLFSLSLVLVMIMSLNVNALASEVEYDVETAAFPEEFIEPDYIYTEEDLLRISEPEAVSPIPAAAGTYVSTFSSLSNSQIETVIGALGKGNILRTTYNGTQVFAFTSGGKTIYLPKSQLFRQTSGLCSLGDFNSTLSSRINNDDTSEVIGYAYYSYQYSFNGNTVFRFSIAKVRAQAYYHTNNDLYFKIRVDDNIGIDVYETFIFGTSYTGTVPIRPIVTLKITNTGGTTNSLYMGGYELEGFGRNTSTTSMGDLISLGYKSSQIFGTVASGLTVKTLLSLFNDSVELKNDFTLSGRNYFAEPMCLSNPAKNVYAYTCKTECPFAIQDVNDYMILKIGLRGTPNSSSRYSIVTSF